MIPTFSLAISPTVLPRNFWWSKRDIAITLTSGQVESVWSQWPAARPCRLRARNLDLLAREMSEAIAVIISIDHQKFLGNTVGEIAREKVGIIRAGGVVVTSAAAA